MSFDESADYDPFVVENYIAHNMQFFKRWTLNNITLNQLNDILLQQQMMPAVSEEGKPTGAVDSSVAAADSSLVSCHQALC